MTPVAAGDFGDCLAMRSDPHVTRYVGGTSPHEDVWSRILRYVGMWSVLGYGYWAVRETATGRFVGEVGLADYRRDTVPNFSGTPEAGWVTAAWAHGQGLASEALEAMLGWSDENLTAARTVCMINAENVPSIRLAERWGYRPFSASSYKDHPVTLYERPRGSA
jgi:RimJ/RimL family protein N-acetyltransferase